MCSRAIPTRASWSITSASCSPSRPAEPSADLPKLVALAKHDSVVVKISGVGTLSKQPFPYKDIWDPLRRIFDAFGLDRCMWGTDWTREVAFLTCK